MALVKVDDRSDLVDALNRIYHRDKASTGYGDLVVWRHSSSSYLLDVDNAGSGGKHADFGGVVQLTDSGIGVTGTGKRITADLSNATLANRLLVQTSTANNSTLIGAIPNGTGTVAGWYAYNNATPASATLEAIVRATSTGMQIRADSPAASYLPITYVVNNTLSAQLQTAGTFSALGLVASATYNQALIGTELLYVAGNALLSNTSYLLGRNNAGTGTINLIRATSGDRVETGQTGTRHDLLGTVVAPSIDPPTVNGQVTAGSQIAAAAHVRGGGGTGSIASDGSVTLGNNFNITSVTRNLAGDYSIAVDRDFSDAYYVVQVTVIDDSAVVYVPKVNSQTASSFDVHIWTTAGTKTDPDGFNVTCSGTLS